MHTCFVVERLISLADADVSQEQLRAMLRELDARCVIDAVIERLQTDKAFAEDVIVRASTSVNGFVRLYLAPRRAARQVRLHIWTGELRDEGHVHSHRWPFTSRILAGELEVAEFREEPGGELNLIRHEHESRGFEHGFILRPVGTVALSRTATHVYRGGDVYTTSPEVLHRTIAKRVPLATVLVEGRAASRTTSVYSASESSGARRGFRSSLSEVLLALQEVQRTISPGSPLTA